MTDGRSARVQSRRGPHPLTLFLSLVVRQTKTDPKRLRAVLKGLRRYQDAPLPAPLPPSPVIARRGTVSLRLIGGTANQPTIVVVPSLINAAIVLDLAPGRSLVRHLVSQGYRVLMVDWGPLGPGERRLGLGGLVSARLLPLVRALDTPVHLIGYCLGGTIALAAAQLLGSCARSLSLIASPWHFSGYPAEARTHALGVWSTIAPIGKQLGAVPVSLLNPMFWSLDEDAVLRKFERLGGLPADDPGIGWFAAVEDWANSGAPLSLAAARDLFGRGYGADLFGRGRWKVAGTIIRPEALSCPVADFVALKDRIVPPEARIRAAGVHQFEVEAGHVGLVVGKAGRSSLWVPLSNWLSTR